MCRRHDNSQQASLRVFRHRKYFQTKKVYLSGKNSVPFPQRRPAGETLVAINPEIVNEVSRKYNNSIRKNRWTTNRRLDVFVTILANKKNNYSTGSLKTNSNGKIILLKLEIENIIDKAMNEFIMDYSSTIDECKDSIIITVENISDLDFRIKKIEKHYPENAKNLSKLVDNCSNKIFKPLKIEYKIDSEIKIIVQEI